jgi:gephyrin
VRLTDDQINYIKNNNNKTDTSDLFIFDVVGSSNAGDSINFDLLQGQCIQINTGAPVPLKADLVIQIEDTISLNKNNHGVDTKIKIVSSGICGGGGCDGNIILSIGQDIRPIGFDIKVDQEVVPVRAKIAAAHCGICATVGALNLKVFKVPTLALVSTGNELAGPNVLDLKKGQIRDSNKSLLYCALKAANINTIVDAGVANDNPSSILRTFRSALSQCDVVISTGGVSMGNKVNIS